MLGALAGVLTLLNAVQFQTEFDSETCIVDGLETLEDDRVDCGTLTVPENHDDPAGRMLQLPVIVIRAANGASNEAPLLYTAGGPGSTSLGPITYFKESPLSTERDVILFEQRGAPNANSALACPEVDEAVIEVLGSSDDPAVEADRWAQAAEACFERLRAEGIDPNQYNTGAIAADIELLREELGYEQLNIFGLSYSTRLALHYARQYPDRTRSLVLDSPVPPDVTQYEDHIAGFERALLVAAERCTACESSLMADFERAVDVLNANPAEFEITHPLTDQPFTVRLTGYDLASGVFEALYNSSTVELIPFLLAEVAAGNTDVLQPLAQSGAEEVLGGEWGLFYAIQCMDEYPFNEAEAIAEDRDRIDYLAGWRTLIYGADQEVCAALSLEPTPEAFREPVTVDVPAIILSGSYDPITPPAWGEQAAQAMPNAYHYEFTPESHVVFFENACAREMVESFLEDPGPPPDECVAAQADRLTFVTEGDIIPTRAIYILSTNPSRVAPTLIVPGLAMLAFVGVIALRPSDDAGVRWLAVGAAGAGLVVAGLLIYFVLSTPELILGFGLPRSALIIGPLVVLQMLLSAGTLVALLRAGLPTKQTTFYSVFLLLSTAFVAWLGWMFTL